MLGLCLATRSALLEAELLLRESSVALCYMYLRPLPSFRTLRKRSSNFPFQLLIKRENEPTERRENRVDRVSNYSPGNTDLQY